MRQMKIHSYIQYATNRSGAVWPYPSLIARTRQSSLEGKDGFANGDKGKAPECLRRWQCDSEKPRNEISIQSASICRSVALGPRHSGKPLYLAIAEAIAADIRAGPLSKSDWLPPQRRLAAGHGIDVTTVSRASALAWA
jgi:hypothetical protein